MMRVINRLPQAEESRGRVRLQANGRLKISDRFPWPERTGSPLQFPFSLPVHLPRGVIAMDAQARGRINGVLSCCRSEAESHHHHTREKPGATGSQPAVLIFRLIHTVPEYLCQDTCSLLKSQKTGALPLRKIWMAATVAFSANTCQMNRRQHKVF